MKYFLFVLSSLCASFTVLYGKCCWRNQITDQHLHYPSYCCVYIKTASGRLFFRRTARAHVDCGDVITLLESAARSAVTSSRFVPKQCSGKSHVDDPDWSALHIFCQIRPRIEPSTLHSSPPRRLAAPWRHVVAAEGQSGNQRRTCPCR